MYALWLTKPAQTVFQCIYMYSALVSVYWNVAGSDTQKINVADFNQILLVCVYVCHASEHVQCIAIIDRAIYIAVSVIRKFCCVSICWQLIAIVKSDE